MKCLAQCPACNKLEVTAKSTSFLLGSGQLQPWEGSLCSIFPMVTTPRSSGCWQCAEAVMDRHGPSFLSLFCGTGSGIIRTRSLLSSTWFDPGSFCFLPWNYDRSGSNCWTRMIVSWTRSVWVCVAGGGSCGRVWWQFCLNKTDIFLTFLLRIKECTLPEPGLPGHGRVNGTLGWRDAYGSRSSLKTCILPAESLYAWVRIETW